MQFPRHSGKPDAMLQLSYLYDQPYDQQYVAGCKQEDSEGYYYVKKLKVACINAHFTLK